MHREDSGQRYSSPAVLGVGRFRRRRLFAATPMLHDNLPTAVARSIDDTSHLTGSQ